MRILLVDDDPLIRISCANILSVLGHEVTEAGNGHEATLAWEEHGGFDAVVTDVRMPRADGIYLLSYLSGSSSPPPCYVHSGDDVYRLKEGELNLRSDISRTFPFAKFHSKLEFGKAIEDFLTEAAV